ncbi:hypothetical protein BH23BAC3_BH23BAC3_09180 [soil metagenome]
MVIRHRILLVDENESIHEDVESILSRNNNISDGLQEFEDELFGSSDLATTDVLTEIHYHIDHVYQDEEAVQMVVNAVAEKNLFACISECENAAGYGWYRNHSKNMGRSLYRIGDLYCWG